MSKITVAHVMSESFDHQLIVLPGEYGVDEILTFAAGENQEGIDLLYVEQWGVYDTRSNEPATFL